MWHFSSPMRQKHSELCSVIISFFKAGFLVYSWLFWNTLCRPGCSRTQTCLSASWVQGLEVCAISPPWPPSLPPLQPPPLHPAFLLFHCRFWVSNWFGCFQDKHFADWAVSSAVWFLFYIHSFMYLVLSMWAWHTQEGQGETCRSWLFPFARWILGIQL